MIERRNKIKYINKDKKKHERMRVDGTRERREKENSK